MDCARLFKCPSKDEFVVWDEALQGIYFSVNHVPEYNSAISNNIHHVAISQGPVGDIRYDDETLSLSGI